MLKRGTARDAGPERARLTQRAEMAHALDREIDEIAGRDLLRRVKSDHRDRTAKFVPLAFAGAKSNPIDWRDLEYPYQHATIYLRVAHVDNVEPDLAQHIVHSNFDRVLARIGVSRYFHCLVRTDNLTGLP